jgi:hypothetical protein
MSVSRVRVLQLLVVAMLTGCGGKDANLPKLVAVTGTVTFDGKPLSSAVVSFFPIGSTRGTGSTGYTDKSGKYEISSRQGGKGAPVGDFKVVIAKLVMPDGSDFPVNSDKRPMESGARQILPAKYSDWAATELKATVHDGDNVIDLPLHSKP